MLGSLAFLILIKCIVICLSYGGGGGWQPPYGQQKPPYGYPGPKNLPYICTLPPEHGPCQPFVAIPRYYYNVKSGQCELFYYGGCEGNLNNFQTITECQKCCPAYTSISCPTVNITVCQSPVNSVTGQCLGGSQITECGTACPLICGEPPAQFCTDNCAVGACQCPPDFYRRVSDCQCVKKECCSRVGWAKRYGSGQYPLC